MVRTPPIMNWKESESSGCGSLYFNTGKSFAGEIEENHENIGEDSWSQVHTFEPETFQI
jgi:hypothetical protein